MLHPRLAALAALFALPSYILCITPEQMLAAPRRSAATANAAGTYAVFTSTSYDWSTHKSSSTWNLMDVASGNITVLPFSPGEVGEMVWIGSTPTSILYINGTNDQVPGGVSLWTSDVLNAGQTTQVASLSAPFSGLKAATTASGNINFLVNCLANPDGSAYNSELVEAPLSSGRLYSDIYVRHWDVWLTKQRFAVFAGTLTKTASSFSLTEAPRNALARVPWTVTRPESPVQPFGDSGDYDLSPDGTQLAFLTKAPQLPKANFTASYIYVGPHDGSSVPIAINGPGSNAPATAQGASAAPRFSPNGESLAYFQMNGVTYESDRNILYVAHLGAKRTGIRSVVSDWDRSPDMLAWGPKGNQFFVGAPDNGTERIFTIPASAKSIRDSGSAPQPITSGASVAAFSVLEPHFVLVSASSLYSSRDFYVARINGNRRPILAANEVDPELAGLGPEDVDSFYFKGSLGLSLHAWIVKPEGFQADKKYPLAFLVHGGPQGAWYNSWSSRWNPKVWADQGYVVIAPNPTGSTSYGQFLTDAIQNNWGSYPYEDLVMCWEYIAANLPYVDVTNGIEAGASYGGYMTNWIQGHDLGRKFKALVTHDGVTSTLNQYTTEELWFMQHDFNGTLWDNRENYERWDPIAHAKNFSTPHFVVHSSLDYRLPDSEGIYLFNVLQELGVPSRFLNFPDQSHWVTSREDSLVWHKEIFNWINYWTGKIPALDDNAIGN